jgi:hypothetical protein
MVGAIPANLHEGSRSEYLAQYVFASFGTVVPVPHHEDSGIDLYCTLAERIGQRAWPKAYFTVQVKSTMDPWIFDSVDSVRWLIQQPLPVLLCVVDKTSARLRIYHTSPRFYAWSLPPLPPSLKLIPEITHAGRCTQWETDTKSEDGWKFTLSAPILDFSMTDILEDSFHETARKVLEMWLEVEQQNLLHVNAGIYSFRMPDPYKTNSTEIGGWATQGIAPAPQALLGKSIDHLKGLLSWLIGQWRNEDFLAAVLGAMLLRHLGDEHPDAFLHRAINGAVGRQGYVFEGVDELKNDIAQRISKGL